MSLNDYNFQVLPDCEVFQFDVSKGLFKHTSILNIDSHTETGFEQFIY